MKRLIAAVALVLLAGCSGDTLDGEVTNKSVDPGYTYVQTQTTCSGNPPICTSYPIIITIPTCYELQVRTAEGKLEDGCVSETNWNRVEIGDDYVGEDVGREETKEKQ